MIKYPICLAGIFLLLPFHTVAQSNTLQTTVTPLTDSVYVHTSYQYFEDVKVPSHGLIVQTTEGVVIVDTAWDNAQTNQLLHWIGQTLGDKVVLAIITHSHADRSAGVGLLREQNISVVSTEKTSRKLKDEGNEYVPEGRLSESGELQVGSTSLATYYPGEGHTEDNIVVWVPGQKVLFGGCLVRSTETNSLGNTAEANIKEWAASIRNVMERFPDAQFVIPGHFSWSDPSSLQHTLKLLSE